MILIGIYICLSMRKDCLQSPFPLAQPFTAGLNGDWSYEPGSPGLPIALAKAAEKPGEPGSLKQLHLPGGELPG